MSVTDCFMSAFIGLCRALSHSPWQCVWLCVCLHVCVLRKDTARPLAGMFGLFSAGYGHFPWNCSRTVPASRHEPRKYQTLTSLVTKTSLESVKTLHINSMFFSWRMTGIARWQGWAKGRAMPQKTGLIYALTPESSEKGRVIYNAISGVKIE